MFARLDYSFFTVAAVCGGKAPQINSPNTKIQSITTSSQEAKPGSLFVPLVDKRDGHDFIEDALRRGAVAFFAKRGHAILKKFDHNTLTRAILVDDPLTALGELAHFHRMRFTPLVIAVTGSNGKTTTKEMLAQIFRHELGREAIATEKNYNNHIGVPFTLFAIKNSTRVAIIEMGMNHANEITYLTRLAEPHAALISSIGHAHIEFFRSRAAIASAKGEVMQGMPMGAHLYVPRDIAELSTLQRIASQRKIKLRRITSTSGFLRVKQKSASGFLLNIGGLETKFPFTSSAWVSNLALAVQAAHDVGVSTQAIQKAVQQFRPASGRMQLLRGFFTIIDDGYNANPDSAIASIDAALQLARERPVVCVFADFKELGKASRQLHAWTGKEAAKHKISAFYAVGSEMSFAKDAFEKSAHKNARSYFFARKDTPALIAALKKEERGSVILVKGSRSMQMEEIVALLQKVR